MTLIFILIIFILIIFYLFTLLQSCTVCKSYQPEQLNDLLDLTTTCPDNTILYNNLCYNKVTPTCIKNATIIDDICYFPDIFVCPYNYTLTNNECKSDFPKPVKMICPDGYNLLNNKCIKIAGQAVCPDGSIPK